MRLSTIQTASDNPREGVIYVLVMMFESLCGSIHISFFCMPEHHICLGFMASFASICFVLQLLTGFCMCCLLYGQDKRHTHISWPICRIHIYPRQGARAHGMCIHGDPRGKNVFVIAQGVPRAILGALPRTTLSLQRCRSFLFCSRRSGARVKTPLDTNAQPSSASAGHKCMCACTPCLCLCSWSVPGP